MSAHGELDGTGTKRRHTCGRGFQVREAMASRHERKCCIDFRGISSDRTHGAAGRRSCQNRLTRNRETPAISNREKAGQSPRCRKTRWDQHSILSNADEPVGLKAQPPLRMQFAKLDCTGQGFLTIRSVHRLDEEMMEVQLLV